MVSPGPGVAEMKVGEPEQVVLGAPAMGWAGRE